MKVKSLRLTTDFVYEDFEVECRDKYELIEKIVENKMLHLVDLDDNKEYYVNGKYVSEFELEEE